MSDPINLDVVRGIRRPPTKPARQRIPLQSDPAPSADEYARRIRAKWRAMVENIIATGQELIKARTELPHGEFSLMIEGQLPFGPRTAQMLIGIARHSVLSNAKHASLLPASWTVLYELSRLPGDVLELRIADGSVHPKLQRHEVKALLPPEPDPGADNADPDPDPDAGSDNGDDEEAFGDANGAGDDDAETEGDANADYYDEDERRLAELYDQAPPAIAEIARTLGYYRDAALPRNDPRLKPWRDAIASLSGTLRTADDLVWLIALLSDGEHTTLEQFVISFLPRDLGGVLESEPPADPPLSPRQKKRREKRHAEYLAELEAQWKRMPPEHRTEIGIGYSWGDAPMAVLEDFVERHRDELGPRQRSGGRS